MRHNYPAMLSTEDNSVMYNGNFVCMSDVFRVLLIIKLLRGQFQYASYPAMLSTEDNSVMYTHYIHDKKPDDFQNNLM